MDESPHEPGLPVAFGKFGKYYPGDVDLKLDTFDLVAQLRAAVEQVRGSEGAGHNLKFSSTCDRCIVRSDRTHVSYVVMNLLLNAVKYSPPGSVVALDVLSEPAAVSFSVADRGIGIPAHDLALLFSPFFRASNVGTRPGTGMGLAIVKKSAQLIGARVRVAQRIGAGTEFTVTLAAGSTESACAGGGRYG